MRLLVPFDDPELYKYPNCAGCLRRVEEQNRVLGYRYRCKDGRLCNGVVNPADNTWFSTLRKIGEEPNLILHSLKLSFSLLCGIGVCLAAEQLDSVQKTKRKFYQLVWYVSSHPLKSTAWTIGGPGCNVECDDSHIFLRKYNRRRLYVLEDWWMFGAICRENGECFAMFVPDRTKNTLWLSWLHGLQQGRPFTPTQAMKASQTLGWIGFTSRSIIASNL
jgi:hypothetical protein